MSGNNLDKLINTDINEILTNDEKNKISEMMYDSGLKDWLFDDKDGNVKLLIKMINNSKNPDPVYQKIGDSGFDFMANLDVNTPITIQPMKRALIPTGLHFQIPTGFELQVRSRSGLALKNGIMVLNSPGTVDSGYRGEVKVILFNTGEEPFTIQHGDRIAQGVIAPVQTKLTTCFRTVNNLDDTDRGQSGFGSTGV